MGLSISQYPRNPKSKEASKASNAAGSNLALRPPATAIYGPKCIKLTIDPTHYPPISPSRNSYPSKRRESQPGHSSRTTTATHPSPSSSNRAPRSSSSPMAPGCPKKKEAESASNLICPCPNSTKSTTSNARFTINLRAVRLLSASLQNHILASVYPVGIGYR